MCCQTTSFHTGVFPLTDMYNVSICIDHDISVMTVLDLQQISNHRIGGHRFDEIAASQLKFLGRFIAVLMQEIFVETRIGLSTQLIA